MVKIAIIAAQGKNREIGKDNKLLWHIPEDLKFFKQTTMGKPIIMGRKTYESIGKPLPGRLNIVISRSPYPVDGVVDCLSLNQAIDIAKKEAKEKNINEIIIMGGAQIYEQAINIADKIYLTQVDKSFDADSFFPKIDKNIWKEISNKTHKNDNFSYSFITLLRK